MSKFFRKTDITYDTSVSAAYPDLFDGQSNTANIQGGANPQRYICDTTIADVPNFGDAKLSGLMLNTYINTITQGNSADVPKLKIFKMKQELGDNEGKLSADAGAGTDLVVFSATLTEDDVWLEEDFGGNLEEDSQLETTSKVIVKKTKPFMYVNEAYSTATNRSWNNIYSIDRLKRAFGSFLDGKAVVFLKKHGKKKWKPAYNNLSFWGKFNTADLYWYRKDVDELVKYQTNTVSSVEEGGNSVSEGNSIFDKVRRVRTWEDGKIELASADAIFSSEKTLDGTQACKLRTYWKNQATVTVTYPDPSLGTATDRQEVVLLKNDIPIPVKFDKDDNWDNLIGQEISFDVFIENLEPVYDDGADNLRRAFIICFSEDPPADNETFYSFYTSHSSKDFAGVSLCKIGTRIYAMNSNRWADDVANDDISISNTAPWTGWVPEKVWLKFRVLTASDEDGFKLYVENSITGESVGSLEVTNENGAITDNLPGNWPKNMSIWLVNTKSNNAVEGYISEDRDMENVIFINSLEFKRFNVNHQNATIANSNILHNAISIPTPPNVTEKDDDVLKLTSSYLSIGATTKTDLSSDGSTKWLFFNDFTIGNLRVNDELGATDVKIGYSSSSEGCGRQAQEITLRDANAKRGLGFGDNLEIDTDGTTVPFDYGLTAFTQQGLMRIDWDETNVNTTNDTFTQRENIWVSARLLKDYNAEKGIIEVDDMSIFNLKDDEEYIIYRYNSTFANTHYRAGVKIVNKEGNRITFNKDISVSDGTAAITGFLDGTDGDGSDTEVTSAGHGLSNGDIVTISGTTNYEGTYTIDAVDANTFDIEAAFIVEAGGGGKVWISELIRDDFNDSILISPYRFWLYFAIRNINSTGGSQPDRSYKSALAITQTGAAAGATWNERTFTDGQYTNNWNLLDFDDPVFVTNKDYGFGSYDDEKGTGGQIDVIVPSATAYNEFDISEIVKKDSPEVGDTLSLIISPLKEAVDHVVNIDTGEPAATYKPYLLTEFEDIIPAKPTDFKVQPDSNNPFNPKFSWKTGDDDLWYGFILLGTTVPSNQYSGSVAWIPLNEGSISAASIFLHKTDGTKTAAANASATLVATKEALAGNGLEFDRTTDSYIEFADATFTQPITEMSINAHIVPFSSGSTRYILSKSGDFDIKLDTNDKVVVTVTPSGATAVSLTSSTIVPTGSTTDTLAAAPTNILVTLDTTLKFGNVKLFINGNLEDQSGEAAATGTSNCWDTDGAGVGTSLADSNNSLFIGDTTAGNDDDNSFDGIIEEIVIYNTVIYPVVPQKGEFTLEKPLSEYVGDATGSSKSYSARLFIKDYHNHRGKTSTEISTSSPVSWRKAAFSLYGV